MQVLDNIDCDTLQELAENARLLGGFYEVAPTTAQRSVSFTLVKSRGLLTKTVVVGDDGKPVSSGKISLTRATARRATLIGTATEMMQQLARQLPKLDRHEALIC